MLLRRRRATDAAAPTSTTDVYYASDVHGSEQCWRKFLGAARFYGVGSLIMGGDLTGKAIVPVEHDGDRYTATFLGERHDVRADAGLDELLQAIRYNGMYPWVASASQIARHRNDAAARDALFEHVMLEELQRWIALADERMSERGVDVLVMAGNDDPWACDAVIEAATHVQACDDRVVQLGHHEVVSCSYANPTPWHSPRELDEDALYARLKALAEQVERPESAIFNLHVPPHGTGLDRARKVNPDLTLAYRGGHPEEIPVGSHAVRQILEEHQPLLSLHGHIHESRGEARIGRTLAVNSGSEYNSGRIHGVVVRLAETAVASHQFVMG